MMTLKVCAVPGCPELTDAGRCEACSGEAERRRGTATERGYGSRWRKVRAAYLHRQPLCEVDGCLAFATDVDHIDGLGPKGPRGHDFGNLRALCHSHHSRRTAQDRPGGFHKDR